MGRQVSRGREQDGAQRSTGGARTACTAWHSAAQRPPPLPPPHTRVVLAPQGLPHRAFVRLAAVKGVGHRRRLVLGALPARGEKRRAERMQQAGGEGRVSGRRGCRSQPARCRRAAVGRCPLPLSSTLLSSTPCSPVPLLADHHVLQLRVLAPRRRRLLAPAGREMDGERGQVGRESSGHSAASASRPSMQALLPAPMRQPQTHACALRRASTAQAGSRCVPPAHVPQPGSTPGTSS